MMMDHPQNVPLRETSGNVSHLLSGVKRPLVIADETPAQQSKRLSSRPSSVAIASDFLREEEPDSLFPFRGQAITEEEKQEEVYTGQIRHIFVQGGQGNEACDAAEGCCTVELHEYHQIKDLKKAIRKAFGIYKNHILSTLQIRGAKGNLRPIKPTDLKDGTFIFCKYTEKSTKKDSNPDSPQGAAE